MIPQIARALSSGFTSKQVLDFILKKFPEHSDKIKTAMSTGFTAEQVLKYLSGGKKALIQSELQDFPRETTEHGQTRSRDLQKRENINKGAVAAGTLAAGALAAPMAASALSSAAPAARAALGRAAPQLFGQGAIPGVQQPAPPVLPQPINTSSQPPITPQQQTLPQPEVNIIDPEGYLTKLGVLDKVKDFLKNGNPPEAIAAAIGLQNKKGGVIGKVDPELLANIEAYAQKQPPPDEIEQAVQEPSPVPPTSPESTAKPAKGSIVETPDGIGEVREIRNGKALVEVDGKMRKMLEEELMSPGLPQKDLADLHDELIEGIKTQTGKEVSRHVEWAGYDPEHKELVYRPWGDKEYVYDNIDPEDIDMLTNLLTQRKTTGENYIGSWEAGTESPIGAAMHALITKVRNKAKESGQEKAHKRRYEAVYSAYEPAQKASKQKKDAEKKRLKDEEKRRKAKEKQALQHSRSPSRVS